MINRFRVNVAEAGSEVNSDPVFSIGSMNSPHSRTFPDIRQQTKFDISCMHFFKYIAIYIAFKLAFLSSSTNFESCEYKQIFEINVILNKNLFFQRA